MKMRKDSTNSADRRRRLGAEGRFQAQPSSAKLPDQRPRVKMPSQMKTPPLIQWARPEKMPEPS
jgi:hypothetical protein